MSSKKKLSLAIAASLLVLVAISAGWTWNQYGLYGVNTILRRGGTYWVTMKADDPRLSPSMQAALKVPAPAAQPGPFTWQEPEKGFEVAEMPVMADGKEVDRILLNRIDPNLFRFVARNASDGKLGIDEWQDANPNAVLIVNGSYYDRHGKPDTPIISEGVAMGPADYDAKAGAFVAGDTAVTIAELENQPWQTAVQGARNAMVSYPLLIGSDGQTHVKKPSRWLANRTFVGQDNSGRIIIGTTKEAFFPLDKLAQFLKDAPLDLKLALNLDGGPIACQSVRLNGFERKFYAKWEAQATGDDVSLLRWPIDKSWAMPMVLMVERK